MKLVQKLPLGLALAACMMMSSCSQEDVQVEQPAKASANVNLRAVAQPMIPTTGSWAGNNVFAPGWEKLIWVNPDDLVLYATGTSTKTHLWGNLYLPWIKPLPQILQNNGNNIGNFTTFMYQKKVLDQSSSYSQVRTKIKNLVPGNKYAVTLSASSSILLKNGQPTQYAPGVTIEIAGTIAPTYGPAGTLFDLAGKEAEWVTKTITFIAQDTEAFVVTYPYPGNYHQTLDKFLFYAHVFVGPNAIQEIP